MSSGVPSLTTDLLESARALSGAGAWEQALVPLASLADRDAATTGEVAVLYGEALLRTGRERTARDWLKRVEPSLASIDRAAHRQSCNLLGAACFALGELPAAASAWERALDLASQDDDQLLLARASNNLGAIANLRGDHASALGHYRLAIPAYQRVGQARGIAEGYHNLAITCRDMGELEQADEHELQALEYASQGAAPRVAAMARIGRAEVALRRGDARFAELTASLAADELAALGDPLNESDARRLMGAARAAQGRTADALAAFEQALSLAESRSHALNRAEILRDRVEAWAQQGNGAKARDDARAAIALFSSLGALHEVGQLERRLATLEA
jgi:tetratricopeptide (TPR) repeat protein